MKDRDEPRDLKGPRLRALHTLAQEWGIPQRQLVEASRAGRFVPLHCVSQRLYLVDLDRLEHWLREREVSPAGSTFLDERTAPEEGPTRRRSARERLDAIKRTLNPGRTA